MGFIEAVGTCYRNYVNFNGRARRSEYWFFALYNFLAVVLPAFLSFVLGAEIYGRASNAPGVVAAGLAIAALMLVVNFLPGLAVLVRRLHDTNASGLWALLMFVPQLGGIALFIWCIIPGTRGANRYGPSPLPGDQAEVFA